jgi:uncharacterized protein YkwD
MVLALACSNPISRVHANAPAQIYIVQPGDTLLAIALRFNVSVQSLQTANNLANPDRLQVGAKLTIPAASDPVSTAVTTHIVKSGDTLLGICLQYGISLQALLDSNNLKETVLLQIGQRLQIPVAATAAKSQPQSNSLPEIVLIPIDASTASTVAPVPDPTPIQLVLSAAPGDIEGMRAELLALYNHVRAEKGLPRLSWSPLLQQAAQAHAEDCVARGSCSHFGSDGSRSSQRIARVGYTGKITGENWAWARTATKAFDMWYYQEIDDNGPHLRNILGPRYAEVGFGIAASRGGYYMIANFGAQ